MTPSAKPDDPWDQQYHACLTDIVSIFVAYPETAKVALPRMIHWTGSTQLMELAIKLLVEQKVSAEDAVIHSRIATRAAISLATEPLFTGATIEAKRHQHVTEEYQRRYNELSPEQFPHICATLGLLQQPTDHALYIERGLDQIIDGLRGIVSRSQSTATNSMHPH